MLGECQKKPRKQIAAKIDGLERDPSSQGRPLVDALTGFRRVAAAGRYRVVFHVDDRNEDDTHVVTVVAVGIRKDGDKSDVYAIATRLMEKGELLK